MRRAFWVGLVLLVGASARADDQATQGKSSKAPVRASATVEVLDDATKVDDVVSRMRRSTSQGSHGSATGAAGQGGGADATLPKDNLKRDRPVVPFDQLGAIKDRTESDGQQRHGTLRRNEEKTERPRRRRN